MSLRVVKLHILDVVCAAASNTPAAGGTSAPSLFGGKYLFSVARTSRGVAERPSHASPVCQPKWDQFVYSPPYPLEPPTCNPPQSFSYAPFHLLPRRSSIYPGQAAVWRRSRPDNVTLWCVTSQYSASSRPCLRDVPSVVLTCMLYRLCRNPRCELHRHNSRCPVSLWRR